MPKYELFYQEIQYRDSSKTAQTNVLKLIKIDHMKDDSEAIFAAKLLIKSSSENPLVDRKIPVKLVRIVPVDSWK